MVYLYQNLLLNYVRYNHEKYKEQQKIKELIKI